MVSIRDRSLLSGIKAGGGWGVKANFKENIPNATSDTHHQDVIGHTDILIRFKKVKKFAVFGSD